MCSLEQELQKNNTVSLKKQIVDIVFEDVVRGNYPPSTVLTERMLIERFQVSKSPVREALIELCSEGVLTNIPRCGYQVTPILPSEVHQMQELRAIIELGALDMTIRQNRTVDLEALREIVERGEHLHPDEGGIAHWNLNIEFHLLLCKQCQNPYIYQELQRILRFFSRAAMQYYARTWSSSGTSRQGLYHREVYEALRTGDYDGAREALRQDVAEVS